MERVFYYFEQISRIPRESGNEKAVSDWILNWTKTLGLEAAQDAAFNLVIRKKASAGYENAAPVILQAHMDMVCEKTPESGHDFRKDPILLKAEGDWMSSACGTSLGADNGIGMACAMAILEDESLCHPPLEVIFTVEEETTFKGADFIDPAMFAGRRMINLDHADDSELIAGSCGGTGLRFWLPLRWGGTEREMSPEQPEAARVADSTGSGVYEVTVCGLLGGHSGEDIHRGRGNAIQLLVRLLQSLEAEVISLCGGTNRLAICREAKALVRTQDGAALKKAAAKMEEIFRKELGEAAPDLEVRVEAAAGPAAPTVGAEPSEEAAAEPTACADGEAEGPAADTYLPLAPGELEKIAAIVRLFPDGIQTMSGTLPGLVNCSNNLGILKAGRESGMLEIVAEIRGLYASMVEDVQNRIEQLAACFGAKVEYFAGYVSWEYARESALRATALEVYRELYGEEMRVSTVHAGLEGGSFKEKVPDMDIISIGPDCAYFHSPKERVRISSVKKHYQFLTAILSRMH